MASRDAPETAASGDPDADTREYIRVRPTTDPIAPDQVAQAFRKLHAVPSTEDGGLFAGPTPTVELCLLSPANSQRVDYRFGIEGGALDALDRALDVCFPTTYERTRTSRTLADALTTDASAETADTAALTERPTAGIEFLAEANTPDAWQTRLTPFADFQDTEATDTATWPLGSVLAALARMDVPVVLQTVLEPMADWTAAREERIHEARLPSQGSIIGDLLFGPSYSAADFEPRDRDELLPETRALVEELEAIDPRHCFAINTRAVAVATPEQDRDPAAALADLSDAFATVGQTDYQLTAAQYATGSEAADRLTADLLDRRLRDEPRGSAVPAALPRVGPALNDLNPRIVADPETAGSFAVVGGESLPEPARRAIRTKPRDSVPRPLPPRGVLDEYRTEGFRIGLAKTTDDETEPGPLAISPAAQARHLAIIGMTGAGKSMLANHGLASNVAATEGLTVILETKDGQFADNYERIHYAMYGDLEAVSRFDAHERLPAAPVLDIERALDSGLSRSQAIQTVTQRLEALLRGVMGTEAYEQAFTSSRVIRLIAKALFDRVHGETQYSLADLQTELSRLQATEHAPPVSNERIRRELDDLLANSQDTFTEIIRGAARRLGELAGHEQLASQLNYVPGPEGTHPDVERFDWREYLDENAVIILDTSQLAREPQRVVTLLTLSQLWTALRRRTRERRAAGATGDPPLVNIHVEEAPTVATADLLDDYLSQGRSFGAALSLTLQFPRQFEHVDRAVYEEVINNTGTVITGEVSRDPALAETLATSEVSTEAVANRLRALGSYEWLCRLPRDGTTDAIRPFTIASGPLPPGMPEGPDPLTESQVVTLEAARVRARERTSDVAVPVGDERAASSVDQAPAAAGGDAQDDTARAATTSASRRPQNAGRPTLDTTGPFTNTSPPGVQFDTERYAWCCAECGNAYGSSLSKLLQAVDCHGSREALDPSTVPPLEVDAAMTRRERERSPYTDAQLVFMQLLYNVRFGLYDRYWEFDLVWDDMELLVAAAGLSNEALSELILDGCVVEDRDSPRTCYSLTASGREAIHVAHREGVVHGDGKGDLSESNFHAMIVETMRRVFHQRYVAADDHPGDVVETYHGVADGRLDVAVLDAAGDVVVAGEAERSNNDTLRAVPADYDKMAACDPAAAVWVVPSRDAGHEVIRALHNAPEGGPRVQKTYESETPLKIVTIDEPGFSEIRTIGTLQDELSGDD
jgi:hypothetical protein